MKNLILILVFFLNSNSTFSTNFNLESNYYIYNKSKIYLAKNQQQILVKGTVSQIDHSHPFVSKIDTLYPNCYLIHSENNFSQAFVDSLQTGSKSLISFIYNVDGDIKVALSNEVILKLKTTIQLSELESYCIRNKILIQPFDNLRNVYTLTYAQSNENTIFKSIRSLEKAFDLAYIEPNFIQFGKTASNDALYNQQWHLKNTGQLGGTVNSDIKIEPAWNITNGDSTIKVAIIEPWGLISEFIHPDLNPISILDPNGFGYTGSGNSSNYHGLPCAGIIAAKKNNSIGVAGICNQCKIIAVKVGEGGSGNSWYATNAQIANTLITAYQNADIISNSNFFGSSSVVDNAISDALTYGRGGKGVIIFSSTGNGNSVNCLYPSSNPNTIAVGAMSMCNQRKSTISCDGETSWGGNYGTEVDISAPGVKIMTTDVTGTNGYSSTDYTYFNGTSSACPVAAGIAGLCLSINPLLTHHQLRAAIESSCSKVGSYSYATNKLNGTWSYDLGYGMVNAFNAVLAAQNLILPINDSCHKSISLTSDTICNYQTFSLKNATKSKSSIPNCISASNLEAGDVWFKFIAKSKNHTIKIDPEGTLGCPTCINPIFSIYKNCTDSLLFCQYNPLNQGGESTVFLSNLVIGQSYTIRIFHSDSLKKLSSANFDLCITHIEKYIDLITDSTKILRKENGFDFSYRLKNNGDIKSGKFKIQYLLSKTNNITNQAIVIGTDSFNNLDSSATVLIKKSIYLCDYTFEDSSYYFIIKVNADSSIKEANYQNNHYIFSDSILQKKCTIDLALFNSNFNISNQTIIHKGCIKNIGTLPSSKFKVCYFLSKFANLSSRDLILKIDTIAGLNINDSFVFDYNFNVCDKLNISTNYFYYAYVDYDTLVVVDNKINNSFISDNYYFSCFVDLFSSNYTSKLTNNNLSYNLTINNNGTMKADSFEIEYFLSNTTSFLTKEYILKKEMIDSIGPNKSKMINDSFELCDLPNLKDSLYYLFIQIDKNQSVIESNENNNYKSTLSPVIVDCIMELKLLRNNTNAGIVYGSGLYKVNTEVNIDATVNSTWLFQNWTENNTIISTKSSDKIILNKNRTIIANYSKSTEINTYRIDDPFMVYPNPSSGIFYMPNLKLNLTAKLYSIDGRLLNYFTKLNNTLDLSNFDNGIYFLEIEGHRYKLIIAK